MIRTGALSRVRRTVAPIHRWLGLAAATLWLVQAMTGVLITFHWEMDDATITAPHHATDLPALERRMASLAPVGSGRHVSSLWTSAGFADRYDITVADKAGRSIVLRVLGDGQPIRTTTPTTPARWIDTIVALHQTLLAGSVGRWIVGASGLLLLTNIATGLVLAWPRRGTWPKVLRPGLRGPSVARHYGWHRAVGLIGAIPASISIAAGVLLAFDGSVSTLLNATPIEMPAHPGQPRIGFAQAVTTAERAIPGSRLIAVDFPRNDDATYEVRLRAPGEWGSAYGASLVFVDALDGRTRGLFPIATGSRPRRLFETLFPIHTGQAGGLIGRLLALCVGLWLLSMAIIGVRLWWLWRKIRR